MIVMGTLYEDLPTFMIISCCILCIMRNVSYKSSRDQNTHFMFNKFSSKIMSFMKYMEKYYCQTGHRWQYNRDYVLCLPVR
jgi:Tfp pilus assembly protein PilE